MNCLKCNKSDEVVTRPDGTKYCLDCGEMVDPALRAPADARDRYQASQGSEKEARDAAACSASLSKREKQRAKSKAKKAKRKAEVLKHWAECCDGNLKPWDCFCSFGCDCCDIHQRCEKCGSGYREHEIQNLSNVTTEARHD